MEIATKLKLGYAALIGASDMAFNTPGFILEISEKRAEVAWENWYQPIWLVTIYDSTVCVVAPQYAAMAERVFGSVLPGSLLSSTFINEVQGRFGSQGWQPFEIFYYPDSQITLHRSSHQVLKLTPEHPEYRKFSEAFSGNTYVVMAPDRQILSWAGIKDHGYINEIAVGTEAGYQRKGMGKAVVAHAVADIFSRDRVPVYVPDTLSNAGSYALAESLGFEKVGEMLLWEIH